MMPSRCAIGGNSHCGRPKGRNSPPEEGQKQKSSRLCNFFSIRDSLPPLQSENRPLYGQLSTFSRPDPRFGATRQSLIAKKLQSEPIFCFQAPTAASGKAMGGTARAQCYKRSGVDAMLWVGRAGCSALWTGRSGAVPRTRRRRKRSGHGFTECQIRWRLRQAMQSPQPRFHGRRGVMPRE